MKKNICHFIPYHKDYHSIHTINFVLETKQQQYSSLTAHSVYKIHYVHSGKGRLHLPGKIIDLSEGDIFFTFPDTLYCIESDKDFSYIYISFLGSRANMIMDKLNISSQNFLFNDCREIGIFMKKGLNTTNQMSNLIAESILLYSFYFIGNRAIPSGDEAELNKNAALTIKKYIDDNFTQQKISLNIISKELSYSPKYISMIFKKRFNVGIIEYINTVRIQNACTLMEQGFTSISDVSTQCGYTDPQYFSKLFKRKVGISPKEYIKAISH